MATTLIDSVLHWRKKLDNNPDDEYILNVIRKLSKVPMTLDLLEVTHIGKTIRKLSKREDIVGEKAKILLNKWRERFTSQDSDKNPKHPNISKKENVNKESKSSNKHEKSIPKQKQTFHNHEYKHKTKTNSLGLSDKPSKKYINDSSNMNNPTESSHSLYEYEVKERNLNYVDYDPHAEVSEGYNPECPELFPTDKPVKTKKTFLVETYEPSSVRLEPVTNDKSLQKNFKSSNHLTSNSNIRTESEKKDKHTFHKDKSKNNSNSSTLKKESHKIKSHSGDTEKLKTSDVKETKGKELCDNVKTKSKKTKVKILSAEEFTSSEVSFEDCLGFNDIVPLKKSSKSHSVVKKLSPNNTHCKDKSTEKKTKDIVSAHQKVKKSKDSHSDTSKRKLAKESSSNNIKCKVSKDAPISKKEFPFIIPKPDDRKLDLIMTSLPEINPNYKPLPRGPEFYSPKKELTNEDAFKLLSSRKQKTAIYSGKKTGSYYTEVPTLFEICTRILIENLDAIECVGDADYDIMKPVLERCSPTQLYNIENYNPGFIENTNELWKAHCKREFKLLSPTEHETWRELYWRARDEREKKLKYVTSNICANISKSTPIRQVKLAYVDDFVKPPRDVARKQAKHGTAASVNNNVKKPHPVKIISKPSSSAAVSTISSNNMSSSAPKKPKLAPLMAKTLKSLKAFRRK